MKDNIKLTILLLLFFVSGVTLGQKKHLDKGDEFFKKRMYIEAIDEYKLALEEKMVFSKYKMTKRIAQTYKMLFDYESATEWYGKLSQFTDEAEPQYIFDYALLLCNLEQYEQAKEKFTLYFETIGKSEENKNYQEICDWAIQNKDKKSSVSVAKSTIETGGRSMGLDFYKEGVVYSKPQSNEFSVKTVYYDLAYTKRLDTAIFDSSVVLSGEINNSFYEGTPSFNKDQTQLYYTGNATEVTKYRDKKVKRKGIPLSKEGLNILHIYSSKKEGDNWQKGKSIAINSNDYDCVFPYLSKDGKRLFFASNMPGGYGGFDLYYSEAKGDTSWSAPVNLGANINSELDEMYPYIDSDTLYYSSKGKKGFGGADIFKSAISGNTYAAAENLGKPYNSSKDDFSFIINNKKRFGYFSSNREGVHGYDNIYEFNISEQPDTIRGLALNKVTEEPIGGLSVKLHEIDAKGVPQLVQEYSTNEDGRVELVLKKHVEYLATFFHPGFDAQTFEIPAEERVDIVAKFGLLLFIPIPKKDAVIKIDNIYFDYNKATIKEESFPVLAVIVDYLNKYPDIRVEMSAHTDIRGGGPYNLRLSDKRAKSVVSYLTQKGIAKSRLIGKGYGERKLVNKCSNGVECSEEEHQENRRVEMKVL
jgi:outer membrane protein OmpA-like peptidoglycan-associated protein/tetratricopeptide (TPR) repeat protein